MSDKSKRQNIVDSFNVQFNNYFFHCNKFEAIREEDEDVYSYWDVNWKKEGSEIKGSISLPPRYARSAVFQVIDEFKI